MRSHSSVSSVFLHCWHDELRGPDKHGSTLPNPGQRHGGLIGRNAKRVEPVFAKRLRRCRN
jgi:hypothetical protein